MPVSNPSEFPPHRAGDQIIGLESGQNHVGARVFFAGQNAGDNSHITDAILIGFGVGKLAWTDPQFVGATIIGENAFSSYPDQGAFLGGSQTGFGGFVAQHLAGGSGNVLVGDHALQNCVASTGDPADGNVVIGSLAAQNAADTQGRVGTSVIIGFKAAQCGSGAGVDIEDCVFIGAANTTGLTNAAAGSVVIGCFTANIKWGTAGPVGSAVIIGNHADGFTASSGVWIGNGMTLSGLHNVVIGDGISNGGDTFTVQIGDQTKGGGSGNVVIGAGAGIFDGAFNDVFILETGTPPTGPNVRLLYGNFANGSLVVGNSAHGSTGNTPSGLNTLSIVNGAKGAAGANPNGYFYVDPVSGLHFVGTSGTDTILALP